MKNSIKKLREAIDICGGQRGLARAINALLHKQVKPINQQRIQRWTIEPTDDRPEAKVAAEYAVPIELATDGKVRAIYLRPDVFPLGYEVKK